MVTSTRFRTSSRRCGLPETAGCAGRRRGFGPGLSLFRATPDDPDSIERIRALCADDPMWNGSMYCHSIRMEAFKWRTLGLEVSACRIRRHRPDACGSAAQRCRVFRDAGLPQLAMTSPRGSRRATIDDDLTASDLVGSAADPLAISCYRPRLCGWGDSASPGFSTRHRCPLLVNWLAIGSFRVKAQVPWSHRTDPD